MKLQEKVEEKIKQEFCKLLEEGRKILSRCRWDGRQWHSFPTPVDYLRFRTTALNLIRRVCGDKSDHYQALRNYADNPNISSTTSLLPDCLGIVEAAHRDFEAGLLLDLRSLVQAELLGDFLEQTETLVTEGYHVPAASLSGAVLEDTLRKLCDRHGVSYPQKTNIDTLNAKLAKAGVYDKLVQKRITALADIRNNADHGHFNKFNKEDVEDMVKWVCRFTADYLQ